MELFVLNEEVATMEAGLSSLEGRARLDGLIALAWQLRQRDCRRSLQLAGEAESGLGIADLADTERQRGIARLRLARGEVSYLFADFDAAELQANLAIAAFGRVGDRIGVGDGRWLMASVWADRGKALRRDECLGMAIEDFRAAGDPVRVDVAVARSLNYAAFRDAKATAARLAQLTDPVELEGPSIAAWRASARGIVANHTGDLGTAIKCFLKAHFAAQESGQLRLAIHSASNGADNFATLGDLEAALEWDERALALARGTGWASMIGNALMQTGNVLRLLGRHDEARNALCETLAALEGKKDSNDYAITLYYLGELSLDVGDPAAALGSFRQAEERATTLGDPNFVMQCWRGQANALGRLAQPEDARGKLIAALALAKQEGSADEQIKVLRVYAELHRLYPLPPPAGMTAPSPVLHYLNQALAVAATIDGYIPPGELLDEVAKAHADCGDFQSAYASAQSAAALRSNSRLVAARNRVVAMQVHQETERAHAEAEHHRQLAQTEARRAAALQEASATLETLGLVGREITASLDAGAVFATLYRHVNQLLDTSSFLVFLLESDGQALSCAFAFEAEQAISFARIPIDSPTSFAARCARERQEFVIERSPEATVQTHVPGTLNTLSLLFAPLLIGGRLLGVMSIQSVRMNAYGERERAIFRTLCAYGAIGLDNAGAYASAERARQQADHALLELRESQERLVQSETMASLGTLVAGIAHEINTPLGICVTATSHLDEELLLVLAEWAQGPLGEESLGAFLETARDTVRILKTNTRRAAKLVQSFKQISVDQVSGEMRSVDLVEYLHEVLATLGPSLKGRSASVDIVGPPGLRAHTYPGALAQVITNLIMNSVIHGFAGKGHGVVTIKVSRDGEALHLQYSDDGRGMESEALKRLFDPFYTTTRGTGGSGLGAHIIYNLVTGPLAGRVRVSSAPGQGLHYDIRMPADLRSEPSPGSAH